MCIADQYTAVTDIYSKTPDISDFYFKITEDYNRKEAFTNSSKKEKYTLTGDAYKFSGNNSKCLYIRMYREKYGFTENTVPIIVKKGKNGELYPYFIGINPPGKIYFSIMPDSWYMLDEKYIYIYVYRSETVIMKAKLT